MNAGPFADQRFTDPTLNFGEAGFPHANLPLSIEIDFPESLNIGIGVEQEKMPAFNHSSRKNQSLLR